MIVKAKHTKDEVIKIMQECARFLDEKKMLDITILDLHEVNSYFEYFIVATGNSSIQCRAIAKELIRHFSKRDMHCANKPDYKSGWIIIDFGDFIIHIFTEELREYYELEKLWSDALKIPFQ